MLDLLGLAAVALVPSGVIVGLMVLVERWQRSQAALVERQIAVTDAIHHELGAVVAPVARRRGLGGWEIRIAVPLERPDLVGAVTAIARRTLARIDERGADAVPIVLVPRRAAGPR